MSDTIQERVREAAEGPAGYYCATTLYEAADEIDRLRAELDEANDTVVKMVGREQDLRARIEELEAANDHAELSIDHLRTMLDAYRSVVTVSYDDECGEWTAEVVWLPGCIGAGDTAEEAVRTALGFAPGWIETMFERNRARIAELERTHHSMEDDSGRQYAVIPMDWIDWAWGYATHRSVEPDAIWVLKRIGIVACEECCGSGVVSSPYELDAEDCPACDRNGKSHGWVFKPTNKEE